MLFTSESAVTPAYPGFDPVRAVGLAQGGASFTPSIAPSGPPTAVVQPVPMDTTTQKGSASVPQTPTTSAASSSWGVPRGDPPFQQHASTGWQSGGWNVPSFPRRVPRKPMVTIEIPRSIILTRPGTEPQEVRAREQFDETRPWKEVSDLVMHIMEKLSWKPSLTPETPHLREELDQILEAVKIWRDREILPGDRLYFEEWVHQVFESVLPYKESSRLIASIDKVVANYISSYRVSATNQGAECPMMEDRSVNPQFRTHLDDRLAFMVLSEKFPEEIPIDHPDFNYTSEQKHFTAELMTGRDLVMVHMNRRRGAYPESAQGDDAQRISNLFLLMWGTIPGRLEATEI
ncbi:MAG: hypothetical protein GY820_30760, partial [Gammaproteobacteria bacterium]|nr:hypothetical protein [Gammaproteobacteria bacterium]